MVALSCGDRSPAAPSGAECLTDDDCDGGVCERGQCVDCSADVDCLLGARCVDQTCVVSPCTVGTSTCGATHQLACGSEGWTLATCSDEGPCVDDECSSCLAGDSLCAGPRERWSCDGARWAPAETCLGACVGGACQDCLPGTKRCQGDVAEVCGADAQWLRLDDCTTMGLECVLGSCLSACVSDLKGPSNSGCEYWAVDLDNHYQAQQGPFALILSNPSGKPASVIVSERRSATADVRELANVIVEPSSLEVVALPQRHAGRPGVLWNALRVQSSTPIVAYQFNPLDNVDVFSNDASLLLPANTFGDEYVAVSRHELLGAGPDNTMVPYRGTITVVATAAQTDVSVTPRVKTLAGVNMQTMQAGQTYTYALAPYQALHIKSDEDGGDLSGTLITANHPVGVFSGHEAAVSSDVCCADHLEQQLYPTRAWGVVHIAAKSQPRLNERDYWRVLAGPSGAEITFSPAIHAPVSLASGEFFEIATAKDFVVSSDLPVMVAQILASSGEIVSPPPNAPCDEEAPCYEGYTCAPVGEGDAMMDRCVPPSCVPHAGDCMAGHLCHCIAEDQCFCEATGDPALMLVPPLEQFRKDYVFLTPDAYTFDYVTIVAPDAAGVVIDGEPLAESALKPIPGLDGVSYRVARLAISDGVHRIESERPIGVSVYGYDRHVSYGYAAGLNLIELDED